MTEYVPVDDAQAQRAFAARRAFERATGLTRIGAALPATYDALEGLIDEWAGRDGAGDRRRAAERWESAVYRPLAKQIRESQLGRHFPGERTADIVARLAGHRGAGGPGHGRDADWDAALRAVAAALGDSPQAGRAA